MQKVCREDVGGYDAVGVAQAAGAWVVLSVSLGEERDLSLYI